MAATGATMHVASTAGPNGARTGCVCCTIL